MQRADNGEIGAKWFRNCLHTVRHFCRFVGKTRRVDDIRPDNFGSYRDLLLKKGLSGRRGLGPHALDRSVVVIKAMFDHAYQNEWIDRPMRFGKMFRQSSALAKRRAKAQKQTLHGKKLLAAADIRRLVEIASPAMRAMILLGINGGMGNTDCGLLPTSIIHREKSAIEFPRPKTGIERIIPLWEETLAAIDRALAGKSVVNRDGYHFMWLRPVDEQHELRES